MQYAVLIYRDPASYAELSDEEREQVLAEFTELDADERAVMSVRLQPTEMATCVRMSGGRTLVTDGPFADTKEVLGGIFLVEAGDLDEVLELAARIPALRLGATVEVRPVMPG